MKIPVVVPPSVVQLVVGAGDVPKHVPRAEMEAGDPNEVTFAPRVAPVVVMAETVGLITVGTTFAAQIVPFHVLPPTQVVVTVAVESRLVLL